jgi:hypothetical protein
MFFSRIKKHNVIPAKQREAGREPGPTEPLTLWVPDSR